MLLTSVVLYLKAIFRLVKINLQIILKRLIQNIRLYMKFKFKFVYWRHYITKNSKTDETEYVQRYY